MKNSKSSTTPTTTKTIWFLTLILLLSMLNLPSCKKDIDILNPLTEANTEAEDNEILNYLTSSGIEPDDIEFNEGFIVYQGDAGWDRAALLKSIREAPALSPNEILSQQDSSVSDRQRGILETNLVDAVAAGTVATLTYFIRPSVSGDCGGAWVTAIINAANNWNIATDCRVNLIRVYQQTDADIVFGSDSDTGMPASHRSLPIEVLARAGFPSSGVAFHWISINDNADNWNSKLKTAMHEIGHTLGFYHTGSTDGILIHGTPDTDPNSIMNQGENLTPAFSNGDLRAMRMYYPNVYSTPTNFTAVRATAGVVRISYQNPNWLSRPYYWIRVNKYSATGTLITYRYVRSTPDSTGRHTFTWGGHAIGTTFRFRIAGYNFRRDVVSGTPPIINVVL